MTVYALHLLDQVSPDRTCQHYIGWTPGNDPIHLLNRLRSHMRGRGARLLQVAGERGIGFVVARVWWGGSRELERQLKARKNGPKLCPYCRGKAPEERPRVPPATPSNALAIRRATMSLEMTLEDYPNAMAKKRRAILKLDQQIRQLSETLATFSDQIDQLVAFDAELTNEAQRKAKKSQLRQQDQGYVVALAALRQVEYQKSDLEIDLRLLSEEFSVLKLQRRERLAQLELQAA